jgi:cytoskeletal protein CcmA (bactofilin family)
MAGTSYTRQSSMSDGDTMTAALFNNEFNKLLTAFSYASSGTTGHQHDGGAGEGGNIEIIGDQDFLNKIVVDGTNNRWGFFVEVSSAAVEQIRIQDGAIVPVTDNDIDLGTSSLEFKDGYFDGTLYADAINFNGTAISATAAELNIMDGVTATASELNILDGVTSTAAELNLLDGVTATTAELNILDGVTSTASELNILDGVTATATELNYSDTGSSVGTVVASKVVTVDANKDVASFRNITLTGELDAGSLDVSGDADIDGTLEADAITVDGTALNEYIADTVGSMVGSNTETGITVTYEDGDNTLDFALGAAQTTITSLLATDIKIGEDDQTKIDFETADEIHFYAANVEQVYLGDNIFGPQSDSDVDLGSSSVRWKDAYVDSITVTGEVDGASLDISGDADIDGTLEADAITVDGTALNEYIADTVGAMVSSNTETNITVTYDDTDNTLDFVATGTVTALNNATENELVTVGATTTELDAEANLTFDGTTLAVSGALTVDDVGIDGKVITMTGSTSDTATFTVGTNGTLDIVTTDDNAAAANIQITADGTAELAGTTVTLDSSGGITLDADGGTITFADGGSSLGTITSSGWTGNVVGNVTGNASGTAATVTGAAQSNITSLGTLTALTVDDVAVDGKVITMTGSASDTATITVGTNGTLDIVTTDDNAAAANIQITADGTAELAGTTVTLDSSGGITLDADGGTITFADGGSSLGTITSSGFTGNVVGNVSGTAATVTGAAQSNITSLGTLTALTVDDVAVDGKVITMTGSASDTATITVGTNGTLDIVTTDDSAAAANIQITADGTAELAGTTVTLDSSGGITLDADGGTITFADGGSSLGTITSSGFTGNVVGNVSGTAATVTGAAQSNITSLGTLTALTVDDVAVDGKVITMTGSASDTATITVGTNGTLDIVTTDDAAAAANIQITADGTAELAGTTVTLDSGGDIVLDADGADIKFSDDGTEFGSITNSSTDLIMKVATQDKDILFQGDDGGTGITALKLDMSEVGAAVFSGTITANENKAVGTYSIVTSAPTSGSGFPTGHVWYVVS